MIDDRAFRPNTLDTIGKTEARFRSLGDTSADATTAHGHLLLTFLGGIAEFERDLIRARTGEGRERAKTRGGSTFREARFRGLGTHKLQKRRGFLCGTVPNILMKKFVKS